MAIDVYVPKRSELYTRREFMEKVKSIAKVYKFYTYILCDSRTRVPFYVGKASLLSRNYFRPIQHEKDAAGSWKASNSGPARKIRRIWKEGGEVLYWIHWSSNNEREIFIDEACAIASYKRRADGGTLMNFEEGSLIGKPSGFKLSVRTRRRMSNARKGKKRPPELGAKVSASRLASPHIKRIAVRINGIEYPSYIEAGLSLNIYHGTIRYRVRVGKPGYEEV